MNRTEMTAWHNKGFSDAEAGRPISDAIRGKPDTVKRAYYAGRRAALNRLEREREHNAA